MKYIRQHRLFFITLATLLTLLGFVIAADAEPPIQVIYWQSSDVETPSQDELDTFSNVMAEIQSFFASEMDRHGFGQKTFDFNDIEVVEGKRDLAYYTASHWRIVSESPLIERGWDNQVSVVFFGGSGRIVGNSAISQQLCQNIPEQLIYCNNLVIIPTESRHIMLPLATHEIGHAFSLDHPQTRLIDDKVDVMYLPLHVVPGVTMTLEDFALSPHDATFLNDGGRLSIQEPPDVEIDADVNNDGYVDLYDVLIVRSAMSTSNFYDTDVNNDGATNILDLLIVKAKAVEAIIAAAPSKRKVNITAWGAMKRR